ncbi:MAG: FAD binding domain-containing protein, partial [Phycicoccus sp.]
MKPAPFTYHAPRTVPETLDVLTRVGADGKVLAGGQSLVPLLTMRLAAPGHLVDIGGVDGLGTIAVDERWVRVGALVRHAGLERSAAADTALPLLRQAVQHVAHPAIRNRGTTVGSIVHADPAGEMPAVLALTGGVVEVAGTRGVREVASSEFFLGALETSLMPDELVVAARFGRFPRGTRTAFMESSRRSGDYALAGVAVAVEADDGGAVTRARA